jgi:PEP-CTERM motif
MYRDTSLLTTAKTVLVFAALATAVRADTFAIATGTNTTSGTAQSVNLSPDLIVDQTPASLSPTGQAVSPQFYGSDVLGSITGGAPQEYYTTSVLAGQNLDFQVSPTNPASQPTELLLYDNNGNLVAIASGNGSDGVSSVIDYTVPGGGSGAWTEEVTSPIGGSYSYDLRYTSPLTYTTNVLGAINSTLDPNYYSISTNVGNNLDLYVRSTTPIDQNVELLLYDPNGNLVAIASGNAPDGESSIIEYNIPGGDAGNWVAEVLDPTSTLYSYDLQIQGASGTGPVNPLAAPTPEPSLVALLGISLVGMALARKSAR